jgi:hypothetical protein
MDKPRYRIVFDNELVAVEKLQQIADAYQNDPQWIQNNGWVMGLWMRSLLYGEKPTIQTEADQ